LIIVSTERSADINLVIGEATLLIASNVPLVTRMRLDEFSLADHCDSNLHDGDGFEHIF
jgi:hypothetical protein